MLKKKYRLRKNQDFKTVYAGNKSYAAKTLVLYCFHRQKQGEPRIGFSISKRVGNAVVRNLIKRRLRSAVLPYLNQLAKGTDYVIIGRQAIVSADFSHIQKDLDKILRRSGTLRSDHDKMVTN